MPAFLRDYLVHYSIEKNGTHISFKSEEESYEGSFPTRLLLEMYRIGQLEYMFLMPAIVPH